MSKNQNSLLKNPFENLELVVSGFLSDYLKLKLKSIGNELA